METLQLRDAKAGFSALVDAAEMGKPTVITRHGRPSAMVVPIEMGRKLYPLVAPNFATYLLTMPESMEFERDDSPLRGIDL